MIETVERWWVNSNVDQVSGISRTLWLSVSKQPLFLKLSSILATAFSL